MPAKILPIKPLPNNPFALTLELKENKNDRSKTSSVDSPRRIHILPTTKKVQGFVCIEPKRPPVKAAISPKAEYVSAMPVT
jgi:hypothetical protein